MHFNVEFEIVRESEIDTVLQTKWYPKMIKIHEMDLPSNSIDCMFFREIKITILTLGLQSLFTIE